MASRIAVTVASLLALHVNNAASEPYARMSTKGGAYDIDGFNDNDVDVWGFNRTGRDRWNRPETDPQAGLVAPDGKAIPFGPLSSSSTAEVSSSTASPTKRRLSTRTKNLVRPSETPTPTPVMTPIFTTINGTIGPMPTHVFPAPTDIPYCLDAKSTFTVDGTLDDIAARIYLGQAARFMNVSYSDLIEYGYDVVPNAFFSGTDVNIVICNTWLASVINATATDPLEATSWRRIGTLRISLNVPLTASEQVVFSCPDGTNLIDNQCIRCSGTVANCINIMCTSATSSNCAFGGCEAGFYNEFNPAGSACLPCPTPLNCRPGNSICSTALDSICLRCNDNYVLIDNGTCDAIPPPPCDALPDCQTNQTVCLDSTTRLCNVCNDGFDVNPQGFCIPAAPECPPLPNCAPDQTACTYTGRICALCNNGFVADQDGQCVTACAPLSNCAPGQTTCKGGVFECQQCNAGFIINNVDGTCIPVPSPSMPKSQDGQVTCNPSLQCPACNAGFKLNQGVCEPESCNPDVNCEPGQFSCINGVGICSKCNSGFYADLNGKCAACTAVADCKDGQLTCTTSTDQTCTACNSGFLLSAGMCIQIIPGK